MTYRGKTFCASSPQCANTECDRHFGDAARAAARRWWGSDDAPVAFQDYRPECGEFRPVRGEAQEA